MKHLRDIFLIIIGTWLAGCATTVPEAGPPIPAIGGVQFTYYEPRAHSVAVAGAFNGWTPTQALMDQDAGVWVITIPLQTGEHPFMYVIDGEQWITPPKADDFVPDGFGQTNGVVIVP